MRRETAAERRAWTERVEGTTSSSPVRSKYGAIRTEFNGKIYASKREAQTAAKLKALADRGIISDLQEQVGFTLVPADGKLRAVRYIADFTYRDKDGLHVVDVKGGEATKTQLYRLKRRLMRHVHGITIEEV